MEFKFRAVDDRSPTSSAVSDQPFRGGCPISDPRGNVEAVNHPQAFQRQLEKDRIREEMIARRRALEAEVRLELMMEREMVMRRAAESGLSFEERIAMRFDPRYPLMMPHPVNGWVLEDHRLPLLPPTQLFPEAIANELKPEPHKDKFIFLAKPDPSLSGAKRKAETPAAVGASEPSSTVSMKKPKEEWSCGLCQVSVTSEMSLNEHLQGKKHKANEAGLQAERAAKNSTSGQLPKKTWKPKPADATGCEDPAPPGVKLDKESFPSQTNGKSLVQKIRDAEDEKCGIPLQNIQNGEQLKKGEATSDNKKKKKFKHWCEICKIGAHSEPVMESHKKGKKHVTRLKEVSVKETVTASSTTPDSTQEGKDADDAKEANEKPAEDVIAADAHLPPP